VQQQATTAAAAALTGSMPTLNVMAMSESKLERNMTAMLDKVANDL
jgi:hypothetical protein